MMRNVYLEGEMGEKFGTDFQFNAPTVQDALKCLDANFPDMKKRFNPDGSGLIALSFEKLNSFKIGVIKNCGKLNSFKIDIFHLFYFQNLF